VARLRIPNLDRAVIEPPKLHDYLLSRGHPVGRFKASFFSWKTIYEVSIFHATRPGRLGSRRGS
jgi:hypothetical protein